MGKTISDWKDCEITGEEQKTLRQIAEAVFKRNGGRGEMGAVSFSKWNRAGTIAFDASRFTAGNVTSDDAAVATAKAWAKAIAAGDCTLADARKALAEHALELSMVERLVAKPAPLPTGKMTKTAPLPAPSKAKKTGTNG